MEAQSRDGGGAILFKFSYKRYMCAYLKILERNILRQMLGRHFALYDYMNKECMIFDILRFQM